ncbi:MAG: GNAT family N-acetyltransferase [Treponema sp.]|jgi:ribosomal protein S18 acetylase RimI-like enzyme|nr:GNAT family N-acetyltransferase [Treponema sp.]
MSSFFPLFRQSRRAYRWHILKKRDFPVAESFLREREKNCVSACAGFIRPGKADCVWFIPDEAGNIISLLIYNRSSLFPVLGENRDIPAPRFLGRFLNLIPIHSVQGITHDTEVFESFLDRIGRKPGSRIDYDLLYTDQEPQAGILPNSPPGLLLRPVDVTDIEALFPLQAAYEREEVLPPDTVFNPASCRLTLERIVSREYVLAACLGSRIVGKANTNAESFTRYQIGGVYVHTDCRGLGIATLMTATLVRELIARGKGVSLFVKKRNVAARAVYRRIGFVSAGEYRITYY